MGSRYDQPLNRRQVVVIGLHATAAIILASASWLPPDRLFSGLRTNQVGHVLLAIAHAPTDCGPASITACRAPSR